MTGVEFSFKVLAVSGDAKAEDPETERHKYIALDGNVLPGGIGHRRLNRSKNIEQADDQHQRGVLEQGNEGIHDARNDHLQSLRQDDQPRLAPVPQPQSIGGLVLASRNGLQTTANYLSHVGGLPQCYADQGTGQFFEVHTLRKKQWQHHRGHEQNRDQRNRPPYLDKDHTDPPDDGHLGAPAQRKQYANWQRGDDPDVSEDKGQHQTAPFRALHFFQAE